MEKHQAIGFRKRKPLLEDLVNKLEVQLQCKRRHLNELQELGFREAVSARPSSKSIGFNPYPRGETEAET